MNCKQGDLAILVRARLPQNVGRVVRVLFGVAPGCRPIDPAGEKHRAKGGFRWMVEAEGSSFYSKRASGSIDRHPYGAVPDAWLRPLRDQDGLDETLRLHELEGQ